MIKKLDFRLILLQCFALIFIISGITRLYIAYNGKEFDALMNEDWKKFESLTDVTISDFFIIQAFWTLAGLIIGIVGIGLLNWIKKIDILNSISVIILSIGILFTRIYSSGIINTYLNYFCAIFSKESGKAFFIGSSILLLIGISILWKAFTINKSTVYNNGNRCTSLKN